MIRQRKIERAVDQLALIAIDEDGEVGIRVKLVQHFRTGEFLVLLDLFQQIIADELCGVD